MSKKKEPRFMITILASNANKYNLRDREQRQLQCIKEYAASRNIKITKVLRKGEMGDNMITSFFLYIVEEICKKHIDGVLLVNMASISTSLQDAYKKVGMIKEAGGTIVTVEEGELGMGIRMNQLRRYKTDGQEG